MPSIQCPGCKAHISVPGLINCPLCQTFLDPPFLRESPKPSKSPNALGRMSNQPSAHVPYSPQMPSVQVATSWTFTDWFNVSPIAALVGLVGFIIYMIATPSEGDSERRKVSKALLQCQQYIAGLAEYGDAETPPYTKNWGKNGEFYFAWERGSFHFKNGFGAPVKMSASCSGDLATGEIKHLTVNAKDIIAK